MAAPARLLRPHTFTPQRPDNQQTIGALRRCVRSLCGLVLGKTDGRFDYVASYRLISKQAAGFGLFLVFFCTKSNVSTLTLPLR